MSVIWTDLGDGMLTERQARALKSALSDLMIASERDGATGRELANLYATSVMVYACANLRARAVASVPLKLVDAAGEDVPQAEPLARVLKAGLREVMRRSELAIYFWGRNLLYKRRNVFGAAVGLRWLNPTLWTPETSYGRGLQGFRIYGAMQDQERIAAGMLIPPKDGVYLHLVDFADDFDGVAPAEVAFLEAGLEVEMATTAVSFFRNRAIPALILQPAKETVAGDGQAFQPEKPNVDKLTDFLRRVVKGARNAGRTVVQPVRWEAVTLQQNFKDVAMSDLSQETRRSIAIASEVPYELVVPTASNYAQLYDTRLGWYEGWVRPQVEWYCEGFTEQLAAEVNPDWQIVPDFESVAALKEDAAARQNRVTARVQAGLLDLGRAQRELGDDEPDDVLNGLYIVNGVPVPRERLREIWALQFGAKQATGGDGQTGTAATPGSLVPGDGQNMPTANGQQVGQGGQVAEESPKLPPRPPSPGTNGKGVGTKSAVPVSDAPSVEHEDTPSVSAPPSPPADPQMPDEPFRELKSWAYVSARKGAEYPFEVRALPSDTAAYIRLLLNTNADGLLSPDDLIAAGRADYVAHHLTGQKAYSETALNYRAALLNLVRTAFEEGPLKSAGVPALSRQQFGERGRAEITTAFRQAFFDGLREVGVNTDELAEDEEQELQLRIDAERTYFTALANDLYQDALPIYLEALSLQEDAAMPDARFEDRAAWQRQAVEKYRDFVRARERMETRIDGYVFKGLEQIHTLGRLYGQKNKMQKWVRDPMKDSCRSCLALDGQVHRAREFLKYVIPQDSRLLCHGDRCGCRLEDTDERATKNKRLDRVPLRRNAKGENLPDYLGAIATKSLGGVDVGFYVSLAGDLTLVQLRHRVVEALGSTDGIDWVESLDLHLSLAYAAEPQPTTAVAQLAEVFEQAFQGMQPFSVTVTALEIWNTPDGGKMLVALVEPSEALKALQAAAANTLAGQEIPVREFGPPENYRPHIMLAKGPILPDEMPEAALAEGTQVWFDNVCLVTPESIITAVPLLDEDEEEVAEVEAT